MKYPVKFIISSAPNSNVRIHSDDFPKGIDKQLKFCPRNHCFSSTLSLDPGIYHYQFEIDGTIVPDILRAPQGGEAVLEIGAVENNGLIFDLQKTFVKHNHLVLMVGLDCTIWKKATLNIQTLQGIKIVPGKNTFFEGSCNYQMFVIDLPSDDALYTYFELIGYQENKFYGQNGLTDQEWAIEPFEIKEHLAPPITPSNIVGIYHLYNDKVISDFEKHVNYFEKFPIDYLSGDIPKESSLLKKFQYFPSHQDNLTLSCLLRNIFLETEDFHASLGLLGRFAYEHKQDIATIPFALSDSQVSFWELAKRNFVIASRGIGFQLLGSMTPEIIFGEEIGLYKIGKERNMSWTKTKWNKELFYFYQKLLKLRKKYPVLRQGRFRFVIQDCCLWGIERYMDGEDSVFIFANHSKNNIIVDLTQIMGFSGPIVELLSDHPLKRKKICTIFGESFVAFKQNSSKNKKNIKNFDPSDLEDDDE